MNRLARELAGLRMRQQQQTPQPNGGSRNDDGAGPSSHPHSQSQSQSAVGGPIGSSASASTSVTRFDALYPDPSPSIILDALKKENESLRTRLVDMEREQGHLKRVNEVYREELIQHRRRVGPFIS